MVLATWWALRRWGLSAIGRHGRIQSRGVEGSGLHWAMILVAVGRSPHHWALGWQAHQQEGNCPGPGKDEEGLVSLEPVGLRCS